MSQNVVVFFNKDVTIIKPLMIALLLMKIAFLGAVMLLENGRSCTSKTSWGWGLHDYLRLPWLLTTNTRQLEILVTTLNNADEKLMQWMHRWMSLLG